VIGAIVLAAGASSRMGRPKAALPLGGRGHTVLSMGVEALLSAGVPCVVIVAGAHPDAVRGAIGTRDPRVAVVEHPAWADGQLSSLLRGLDAIDHPLLEAVLVTLVDVPLVSPDTVRALVAAWRTSGAPIVRPADGERHGHPVLFDRRVFAELRAADPRTGAKPVVHAHAHELIDLPVADEGAFVDLDVPADYERVRQMVKEREGRGSGRGAEGARGVLDQRPGVPDP
jgi:molybdenum cofactor cytidylyltransferase